MTANKGIYMGVGWDTDNMHGTDFSSCKFLYTGAASDAFTFDDWSYPITNTDHNFVWNEPSKDVVNGTTLLKDKANGAFGCQFSRKIDTGDTTYDTVIPLDEYVPIIFAFGNATNSGTNNGYI